MNLTPLPWIEVAIVLALLGSLCIGPLRDPLRAWRLGLFFTGAVFACTIIACIAYYLAKISEVEEYWSFQGRLLGRQFLDVDELNAPLLPLVGLLHFLTALATGRTKMRRFSLSWSLASQAVRLATFSCIESRLLVGLLVVGTLPGYVELRNRGKPTRVYVLHMFLFAALLVLGSWGCGMWADSRGEWAVGSGPWAVSALLAAVLIRSGIVPVHCWLTDWFEHASFGNALLFVTPLVGVYAAIRLVLPIASDAILGSMGLLSLVTALYAAGMAVVQENARRFFAYLFLSHASLILVGLELHTSISLSGALALWISVTLSLTGFGLTLRALEARFGRLSLATYRGLYEHSPSLAVCFLLTGLASVGFPGTLGFVAAEVLIEGAVEASPQVGVAVVLAAALNGMAVVRAYFYLFTGTRHLSTVSLGIGWRERAAVLTLAVLILGGGMFPQPGIASRYEAAQSVFESRDKYFPQAQDGDDGEDDGDSQSGWITGTER